MAERASLRLDMRPPNYRTYTTYGHSAYQCPICQAIPCRCQFVVGRIELPPGPWECPRCGRMNGPQTERCVCKPGDARMGE